MDSLLASPTVEYVGLVSDEYVAAWASSSPIPNLKDTAAAAEAVSTNLCNTALLDIVILGVTACKQTRGVELTPADPFLTDIAVTNAILKVITNLRQASDAPL